MASFLRPERNIWLFYIHELVLTLFIKNLQVLDVSFDLFGQLKLIVFAISLHNLKWSVQKRSKEMMQFLWVQVVLVGVEKIWERGLEEHIKELRGNKNTNPSG